MQINWSIFPVFWEDGDSSGLKNIIASSGPQGFLSCASLVQPSLSQALPAGVTAGGGRPFHRDSHHSVLSSSTLPQFWLTWCHGELHGRAEPLRGISKVRFMWWFLLVTKGCWLCGSWGITRQYELKCKANNPLYL